MKWKNVNINFDGDWLS